MILNFLGKLFLDVTTTAPNRTISSYGGEAVQEGFTNLFNIGDQIQCAFMGLFSGNWGCWVW